MKMQRVLTAMVLACGLAGPVQAATLTSGLVFGGPSQDHVACEVVNLSDAPITFVKKQLVGQFHEILNPNFDDCGTELGPNRVCTFQAAAVREPAACKVIINQAKTDVRGTMVALFGPPDNPTPLSEADLR